MKAQSINRYEADARVLPLGSTGRFCFMVLLVVVGVTSGGCLGPGDLSRVQTTSDQPRAGNVYLLRGFLGIWSSGIDTIGHDLSEQGVRASVYQNEQAQKVTQAVVAHYEDFKDHEPLVLVGHSWGADNCIKLAHALDKVGVPVDLMVLIDPVTPDPIPGNVKRCYNIYQSNGMWDKIPYFRGMPVRPEEGSAGFVLNSNIRTDRTDLLLPDTDHYNIEKNPKVQQEVLKLVLTACPPREQWTQTHQSTHSSTPLMAGDQGSGPGGTGYGASAARWNR